MLWSLVHIEGSIFKDEVRFCVNFSFLVCGCVLGPPSNFLVVYPEVNEFCLKFARQFNGR